MSLINISKEMFTNGVFVFDNGDYIFIEEIAYSSDGLYWESTFIPGAHVDPRDPTKMLGGHRYRRVRHAGDAFFQPAAYFVPEDGKNPVFRYNSGYLQYKLEGNDDSTYVNIVSEATLKGETGPAGATGEGWHVDIATYWFDKPDCVSTLGTIVAPCTTCSGQPTSNTSSNPILMLSLGDGKHQITNVDLGAGMYRSNDGITWIQIVGTDVGNYTRFMALDNIGTGTVDYRDMDDMVTRGKVYYCVDGTWTLFLNVAVQSHKLSPSAAYYIASQDGFYMDRYVTTPLNANPIYNSIAMTTDYKLVVNLNSIEPAHLKDGSFGDGFDEGAVNIDGIKDGVIKAKADDFAGFGLKFYTSLADSNTDLQVDATTIVGNGLQAYNDNLNSVDGEDRRLVILKLSDIVEATSGLEVVVGVDTFDNLQIKVGKGILVDVNGVSVLPDDLSIYTDVNDKVAIKPYVAGNDGVLAAHLNPDVVNILAGMELSNTTGLAVKLSAVLEGLDFAADGVGIGSHAVKGIHLNHDIADTTKGIKMDELLNLLEIVLHPAGGLAFDAVSGGIMIDTSNIAWLTASVVTSLEVNAVDYQGQLVLTGAALGTDLYTDIAVSALGATITITPNTNLANLTTLIQTVASGLPGVGHVHPISQVTSLQTALDAKVDEATVYGGNIQITTNGLFIKAATTNTWAKLVCVDDNFNLGTVAGTP